MGSNKYMCMQVTKVDDGGGSMMGKMLQRSTMEGMAECVNELSIREEPKDA
jgi:hypothetical protein